MDKKASSAAAWALLTEGVTSARLEAHRFRHLVTRAINLVESSEQKEHLFQVAGDLITAIPARLQNLETDLDRTALALSKMGDEFLSARLPLSDKTYIEESIEPAGDFRQRQSAQRVAARWMVRQARGR